MSIAAGAAATILFDRAKSSLALILYRGAGPEFPKLFPCSIAMNPRCPLGATQSAAAMLRNVLGALCLGFSPPLRQMLDQMRDAGYIPLMESISQQRCYQGHYRRAGGGEELLGALLEGGHRV